MNQLATGVPLRPSTPQASGWSSPIWPLALNVVITGAPSCSASAITCSLWKRAPWPTMITGRFAPRSRPSACSIDSSGGLISSGVSRPSGPAAAAVAGGQRLHLVGEDQVRDVALQHRVLAGEVHQLDVLGVSSTGWLQPATEPNAAERSTSWNAPGPSTCVSTWPVSASTGARSTFASHRPVSRLVAPGPGDRQARGRPAGELAVGGGRERRGALVADADVGRACPASSWRRSASARPRLEWPTIPKTCRRPS